MTATKPAFRLQAAAAVLLFLLALLVSHATRERAFEARLNSDEPEWIAISILHWRQFVLREPPAGAELDPPDSAEASPWARGVQRTTFGYMNPCLPKLVWGAALHAAGFERASPLAFQAFHRDDPAGGRAAQEALLPAAPVARRVVVALAALSAVLLFFAARNLFEGWVGWFAGAAAYALWFASPLVQNTSSYIRTDFFMLPFCLAALLIAQRTRAATKGLAVALGVCCGLALSSKLNGGLACVASTAWITVAWLRERPRPSVASLLAQLALVAALAFAVFFALDPRLWSGPIDGVRDILARWERLMRYFQDELAPANGVEVAHTLAERISLFTRKTLLRDDPLRPLGAALALLGFAWLALRTWRGDSRATAALIFVAVFVLGTVAWLPLDWERFYLTAMPCLVLLEAVALASGLERFVQRRSVRTPSPAGDAPAANDSAAVKPAAGS